jgi:hypothetical protein
MSHESSGEPGIDQELNSEQIHSTEIDERTLTNDDGDYSSKEVTESNFTVSASDRVDVGTHSNSNRNGYSRSDELSSYDPPKLSSYHPKCSSVSERNQLGANEMVTGLQYPCIPQNESQVGRCSLSTNQACDPDPHNYTNPEADTITLCFHLTIPIGNILQAQNLHYHR